MQGRECSWERRASIALVASVLGMAACIGGAPGSSGAGTGGHEGVGSTDGHPKPPGAPPGAPPGTPPGGPAPSACTVANEASLGGDRAIAPAVASSGGRFAAVWTEDGSLHGALIDEHGNASAPHALPGGTRASEPAVSAVPGGGFLVVWQEPGAVRGLQLGADASASGAPFTLAQEPAGDPRPSVAAAAETEVAWADAAGVTVAGLNGTAIGARIAFPGAAKPSFAAGDALGLVFVTGPKLGFARIPRPLRDASPVLFRDAPGSANLPRASAAGDGFFVTWEDDRNGAGNETVFLTRVGADGKPAGEVAVPCESGSANTPDVATLGGSAAVVYYQFRDGPSAVFLSLFGQDLHRAGDELRISGKGGRTPRVAAGNGALGVVYAHTGSPARFALVTCH